MEVWETIQSFMLFLAGFSWWTTGRWIIRLRSRVDYLRGAVDKLEGDLAQERKQRRAGDDGLFQHWVAERKERNKAAQN